MGMVPVIKPSSLLSICCIRISSGLRITFVLSRFLLPLGRPGLARFLVSFWLAFCLACAFSLLALLYILELDLPRNFYRSQLTQDKTKGSRYACSG